MRFGDYRNHKNQKDSNVFKEIEKVSNRKHPRTEMLKSDLEVYTKN